MFPKYLLVLLFCVQVAAAQPYYTRVRGAFGADAFGIAPRGAVTAEAAFGYLKKSFWTLQAGIGAITRSDFRSPTFSGALTHCFILNPYKRKSCIPQPGNYLVESYFEAGLGGFMVDRYDSAVLFGSNKQRLLTPSGIAGLRFNLVSRKWIYMLKLRFTPPLLSNVLASHAGIGVGVGWR
ncbi:hypothetical protein SAMN04487996_10536 [Dyadobacter soli]|uniref:Outer membrane protein beta-barrel domain-containing protein n=1 Tax=Dyadobacter soli TaxID=659014 RepID=A0A1G7CW30_9BACT|nr:hypothetical protein [Dyadobacter soli]SDE43443.1 hypothetical protein SAMN04487996_10536 [Dyadobacter soli]